MQIDEEILFYCFIKYNNFQDQIRKQSGVLTMKHAKNIKFYFVQSQKKIYFYLSCRLFLLLRLTRHYMKIMKKTNNKKKGIKTLNNAVRPITSKNKPHFLLTGRLTSLPHFFFDFYFFFFICL